MFRQLSMKSSKNPSQQSNGVQNKPKDKTGAKIVLGLLVVGLVGELVYLNLEQPPAPPPIQETPIRSERKVAMTDFEGFDLAQTYPFWLDNLNDSSNLPNGTPPIDEQYNSYGDSTPSFPTNVPRPNLPDLPSAMPLPSGGLMPAIPHYGEVSDSSTSGGGAKITGLILGRGGADSVAIISDGAVVKEGQKYNGNTVISISEHGIAFEDGTRMNYK